MANNLKSGILLDADENLIMELEAELWATSSNPIVRFFGSIVEFIAALLGFRKKGFLVITDKRVVEVYERIVCYLFTTGRHIKYVLPQSVLEIGYNRSATCCCCCPAFHLYYQAHTQSTSIMLKGENGTEQMAKKIVDAFYGVIRAKW